MAIPRTVSLGKGLWHGKSKLNFSEDPNVESVTESDSTLRIATDRLDTFATVTYTWEFEGEPQEGTLILAGSESKDAATAGWVDSWHQNGSVMSLAGTGMQGEQLTITGSYATDWGWRIELCTSDETLQLRMVNVSPDGSETWAVHATYRRA